MPPLVIQTQTVARKFVTAMAAVGLPAMLCAQQARDDANAVMRALQQNDNAQAVAIAGKILIAHPSDCQVLTLRGIALSREGQMSDAKKSFDQALESCPESLPAPTPLALRLRLICFTASCFNGLRTRPATPC
jgi:tetratricopeptide (TPR) repeat protein